MRRRKNLPIPNRIWIEGLGNLVNDHTDVPKRKFLRNNWYSQRRIKGPEEIEWPKEARKAIATSTDNICYCYIRSKVHSLRPQNKKDGNEEITPVILKKVLTEQ